MKTIYVYPGTFSPPTLGHLNIVRQAAAIFPELIIICSENPDKKEVWFSPDECRALWHGYSLPKNVRVMTLSEFRTLKIKESQIVIIRGLRNASDFDSEKKVMALNKEAGVNKFFYIFGAKKFQNISSSRVRAESQKSNWKNLSRQVSLPVITALRTKNKKMTD
jgi:pantetheine-phosphate adenylyltransferase